MIGGYFGQGERKPISERHCHTLVSNVEIPDSEELNSSDQKSKVECSGMKLIWVSVIPSQHQEYQEYFTYCHRPRGPQGFLSQKAKLLRTAEERGRRKKEQEAKA